MSLVPRGRLDEGRLSAYPTAEALGASFREAALAAGGTESVVGCSVEGRPLVRLDIGTEGRPVVLLTALMHGNEVIGSLALLDVLRRLGTSDPHMQRLREGAHFVVMPVVNPDAFHANIAKLVKGENAWRRCNAHGVDLNRNFPRLTTRRLHHPFSGSRFRASPYYSGPHAFSEPESRAVRSTALAARPRLSVAFHSFGNLLLYPWAYTERENPRKGEYEALARAMNQALERYPYRLKQARQLYSVLGDMDDWLDAELGALAFTLEVSRPEFNLRELRHLFSPFCWMNPRSVAEVVKNVAPGVLALLATHLGFGADVAAVSDVRRTLPSLDLAAK